MQANLCGTGPQVVSAALWVGVGFFEPEVDTIAGRHIARTVIME
jgi:hypothetical protein